ncbi:hypothetical protein [Halomonas alkaliantarctica]|uniref:hypothetical protein n=1 Tax=Halomonas alkaliantarctica TaxID=232346 RepID=UPI0012EBB382|nr:hypothetical protein [Halomonas alkaliantarctica]
MKNNKVLPSSGKADSKKLTEISSKKFKIGDFFSWQEPTLYQMHDEDTCLDFLWSPKPGYKNLFVLFSGDVPREKYSLPVFQRWSWAPYFPGNTLYVADPMLRHSDSLGLAWYAGDQYVDPMEKIAKLLGLLCKQHNIEESNIVFYGSSGGGFAALRALLFFEKASAIAINPQTDISKYHRKKVNEFVGSLYKGVSFKKVFEKFESKTNLLASVDKLVGRNIVYAQNELDAFHVKYHEIPFFEEITKNGFESRIKKIRFCHEGGHGKAETPDVFYQSLRHIGQYVDLYKKKDISAYNDQDVELVTSVVDFFKKVKYVYWAQRVAKEKAFDVKGTRFNLISGYYDTKKHLNFLTFQAGGFLYSILQRLGSCEVIISHEYFTIVEIDKVPEPVGNAIDIFLKYKFKSVYKRKSNFLGFLFGSHMRPYHQVYDNSLTFNELCLKSNRKRIVNTNISFFPPRFFPGDVEAWSERQLGKSEKGFFLLSCKDEQEREDQLRNLFSRAHDFAALEQTRLHWNPSYLTPKGKVVIWLGTCFMKRSFIEQQAFFDYFIEKVLQITPDVLFVVDGVTATVGENKKILQETQLESEKAFVDGLIAKHDLKGKLISLIGERAADKLAYASVTDFSVTNALTDSMWCSAFFRKPGVVHYSPLALDEVFRTQRHYKSYFLPKEMISSQRKKGKPYPWADYSIDPKVLSDICFEGLKSALCLQRFTAVASNGGMLAEGDAITLAPNESFLVSDTDVSTKDDSPTISCGEGAYEVKFDLDIVAGAGTCIAESDSGVVLATTDGDTLTFQVPNKLDNIRFRFTAATAATVRFYGLRAQKLFA